MLFNLRIRFAFFETREIISWTQILLTLMLQTTFVWQDVRPTLKTKHKIFAFAWSFLIHTTNAKITNNAWKWDHDNNEIIKSSYQQDHIWKRSTTTSILEFINGEWISQKQYPEKCVIITLISPVVPLKVPPQAVKWNTQQLQNRI